MIDFSKIIAGEAGQRESFEEFVCQVARRGPPHSAAEFRRIHGAGGDGGVEAVWILDEVSEHGYQAKFYTQSAKVDWRAIDKSVETALATHPKLSRMYIAIACSLTGRTQRTTKSGRQQLGGWDHWDTHKSKWEAAAKALGRSVTFVPWTASDLETILISPSMVGLVDYWFGGIELSPAWMATQCARTIGALEERYHREDHVDVSTRAVFDGLLHGSGFRAEIEKARNEVLKNAKLGAPPASMAAPDQTNLRKIDDLVAEFEAETDALKAPGTRPLSWNKWRHLCLRLRKVTFEAIRAATALHDAAMAARKGTTSKPNTQSEDDRSVDYLIDSLRNLQSATGRFIEIADSPATACDNSRFVLIEGRAGSGKSHLIASEVERVLEAGAPAIFLLGTDFTRHGTIENQVLARLEIEGGKFDRLLGALNARAEACCTRGLIAIDALNEGAGAQIWRDALQGLAKRILAFDYLALCVSVRREYMPYLVTAAAQALGTLVQISGFETPEEIDSAAKVYMDRRGIVRPATPWLNPEFSNPLFLRTVCLALAREGRNSFPRGMRGMNEVLTFFLDSTARHLGTSHDGGETLLPPVRKALLTLAGTMAGARADYVILPEAHLVVEAAFTGFAAPPSKTWLELLRFGGLLRIDPNPNNDPSDPMSAKDDVVRFAFQRFQDHLIARALLESCDDPAGLFRPNGVLAFILGQHGIGWQWRGLFYAVYLNCADRFHVELVDMLPGGEASWWAKREVQDAFVESVRWRAITSFSERTLVSLNRLRHIQDIVSLLIELAVVEKHPWNAKLLHRTLTTRAIANRDAIWTCQINVAHHDPAHSLSQLVDWCLNPRIGLAGDATLSLALTTLAWSFTSTSAKLRDTATKGMTCIFLKRPSLIPDLFEQFDGCDDPYVIERLFAALYGAAMRTLKEELLGLFAEIAWDHCFADEPPVQLVTRDYARGVIELAATAFALEARIDLVRCRPPYGAKPPVLNITEARVEARAEKRGASSILNSCYKGIADFGRYILEHRVDRFAAAPLKGPRPLTSEEVGQRFHEDIVLGHAEIEAAFEALRAAHLAKRMKNARTRTGLKLTTPEGDLRRIRKAEESLLSLLSPAEVIRFRAEALHWAEGSPAHHWVIPGKGEGKEVDTKRAKLWVANRAISFGWRDKLFPRDRTSPERRSDGGRVERIGKKYQRIALMELMARLADNYWLKPDWGQPARAYNNPLDTEFVRDIEPSILPLRKEAKGSANLPSLPSLSYPALPADERRDWVFEADLPPERLSLALCPDCGSDDWVALYRYAAYDVDIRLKKGTWTAPWQQSEFYFLALLLLPAGERDRFVTETEENADDFHNWLPGQAVDGPYLGELGRRDTWDSQAWSTVEAGAPGALRSYRVIKPTISFQWESHLDGSLQDGFQQQTPIAWLVTALDLRADAGQSGIYVDAIGTPTIVTVSRQQHSYALIHKEKLSQLAKAEGIEPVWTIIGERSALVKGTSQADVYTRYNGIIWLDSGEPQTRSWSRPS